MPRCSVTRGCGSSVAAYIHMELSSSDCCCLQMTYNAPAYSTLPCPPCGVLCSCPGQQTHLHTAVAVPVSGAVRRATSRQSACRVTPSSSRLGTAATRLMDSSLALRIWSSSSMADSVSSLRRCTCTECAGCVGFRRGRWGHKGAFCHGTWNKHEEGTCCFLHAGQNKAHRIRSCCKKENNSPPV
jgi:hypothetical protein